jgi:cell division protein FtsL
MASWAPAQAVVAEPVRRRPPRTATRPRSRVRTQKRARAGIAWIVVSGILLAGVVFVNVAVLRLNLALDNANQQRTKLRATNAALQSQLSTELASPRIQAQAAKRLGLRPYDQTVAGFVNLAK